MNNITLSQDIGDITIKLTLSTIVPMYKVMTVEGIGIVNVKFWASYVDAVRDYLSRCASEIAAAGKSSADFTAIENLVN